MKSTLRMVLILVFYFGFIIPAGQISRAQEGLEPAENEPVTFPPSTISRVSVSSNGAQANDGSYASSLSADGRFVAFNSASTNLVGGDTNGFRDIFVHDRQTRQTTRISVSSNGGQANDHADRPAISADGRYSAFESDASNLVSGDTNWAIDVFIHDRQTGVTQRISVSSNGTQSNGDSFADSISPDARFVAFYSEASNLVNGDTNGQDDVFVHDRQTGQTWRVSVAKNGTQGTDSSYAPSISADGRFVAFCSQTDNLVPGDTNSSNDIFVHDRQSGELERVSVASDGAQAEGGYSCYPTISMDGRYVTFTSTAENLVIGDTNLEHDVFVHDRQTRKTERGSVRSSGNQGNDDSFNAQISGNGRFVTFNSEATNLVDGDTNGYNDIFIHDRKTKETMRVSVADDGTQGNDYSLAPSINTNGLIVAFSSRADTLVSGDTNETYDVFAREFEAKNLFIPTIHNSQ